jgi:hypothetical protein
MTTKHHSVYLAVSFSLLLASPVSVFSQPVSLDDSVMNRVTAGSENNVLEGSGGAVVGNSSTASIHSVGSVTLSDGAQSNAQSLNLVNSSESTVANGLNIWDGQITGAGAYSSESEGSSFLVNQNNEVNQEQRRSAAVPEYSRPEANTFEQYDNSGTQNFQSTLDQTDSVTDLVTNNHTLDTESAGSVDTIILLQAGPDTQASVQGGKGIAVAGHLDATFDAGEIEVGLAVGGGISVGAGASAGDSSIEVGGSAETTVSVYGRIELPEFSIDVSGAGCGVLQGSCTSSGSTTETTAEVVDNSTLSQTASSESGDSTSHEVGSSEYRSPFSLHNAQAEYIVVDDSSIDVSSEFSMSLSGSAQSDAKAINIVNSAGSAVANGVNISRTSAGDLTAQGGNIITLTQSNVISHSR